MTGVILLLALAVFVLAFGAGARSVGRPYGVSALGWILCASATWLGAGAAGAWFPIWPTLLIGLIGSFAESRLQPRALRPLADLTIVALSGALSMPPLSPLKLGGAALVASGSGMALDALMEQAPGRIRATPSIVPAAGGLAGVLDQARCPHWSWQPVLVHAAARRSPPFPRCSTSGSLDRRCGLV